MATTGAKVMVAAGAVGYMGYLAHQQLQEKQEREAAEKAEKKLRKERQKRWERAAKEWAERHKDGEVDEAEVLRSVMWVELDGTHWFTALTDLIQRSEAAAAQRPARLLSVPVLGEPETPTALAVAAILLMGNSSLLDEHVMLPFLVGSQSLTVDMSEFTSFGFVLSKVSREGSRLLDAWLQDLQKIPTLLEMELDPADMGILDDRALDSLFWVCAGHSTGDGRLLYYKPLVEGGTEARARRARSAKTLFAQLGLFVAPAARFRIMLGDAPGTAEAEVGRRPATKKEQKRFLAMLSEDKNELVVSNIPLDGEPLVFGGLEMQEEAGSFAYMRNQVVKGPKPPEPSAALLRTRTALMVEQMHAKVAYQMQRRLRKLGGAAGWSLEHFAAASGEVDMLRWQPENAMELEQLEPRDILGMLRDNDLSLVEEHRDDLQRKLQEELRSSVPPASQAGSDEQQARAHLEAEVDSFVDDLLQLMQARLVQTPLSDRDQSPMEVVGKFGIYKKVYLSESKAEENSGLLSVLLRQSERERNERSDELAEVPWQMVPACAAAYAAFVLVVFLLLPWQLTLTLVEHLPGGQWLLRTLPGPANATVLIANALGAWWWTVACIKQLGACGWEEALAVLARRLHIFAAKRKGWKIPLARDAEALEERCTATLAAWTSRLLRRQMAEAVERGASTEAEALQVVASAASGGKASGGKASAALPGDAKEAQAWLSLPCLKGSGSEDEEGNEEEEGGEFRGASSGASGRGVRITALGDAVNQALNEAHRSVEASMLLASGAGPLRIEHEHDAEKDGDKRDGGGGSSSSNEGGGRGRGGGFSRGSSGTVHRDADESPSCSSRRQKGGSGGAAAQEEQEVRSSVREFLKSHGWGFAKRNDQMVFRRLVKQQQPGSQASGLLLGPGTSAEAAGGASKEPPPPDQQQQQQQQQQREAKQVDPTYRAGPPTGTRQRRKGGRRR